MGRRLFEDLVASAQAPSRRGGRLAWPVSLALHSAALAAALVLPSLTSADLPPVVDASPMIEVLPIVRPPSSPEPSPGGGSRAGSRSRVQTTPPSAAIPIVEPTTVRSADDGMEDLLHESLPPCLTGCRTGPFRDGVPGATGVDDGWDAPKRAGIDVRPPTKIRDVAPTYPELARRAAVEAIVVIECTIDPLGRVVGAQVLRGHPLLDAAALEAVQQWAYKPTLVNGVPVPVVMTVTVKFSLRR